MIHNEFENFLYKQEYGNKTLISDVFLKDVTTFNDDGGSFAEIIKLNENSNPIDFEFNIKQCSWSIVEPNVIKAFHLHKKQKDLWFVPASEKLLVGLYDVRENSPTYKQVMRFVMGSGKSQLLYIPNGVAHGYANITTQKQSIFYFTSEYFDINDNDEYRLPWNIISSKFWELNKG